MVDIDKAMLSPSSVFAHPRDVMIDTTLNNADKIKVLEQWEYDVKELLTATQENMVGDSEDIGQILTEIHKYLEELRVE